MNLEARINNISGYRILVPLILMHTHSISFSHNITNIISRPFISLTQAAKALSFDFQAFKQNSRI